jgi:hypothetical protein
VQGQRRLHAVPGRVAPAPGLISHDGGMPRLARLLAVLPVLALSLLVTGTAAAEAPLAVTGQVTDAAGVLGSGAGDVQDAIDRLRTDGDVQLFVVLVASFDGRTGSGWAAATAELSGLGGNDLLFAVAVEDRAYGYDVGQTVPPSDDAIAAVVSSHVEPELAAGDWSGAVVALADGLVDDSTTGSGTDPDSGSGGGGTALGVIAGIGVVGGGGYLLLRNRRRKRAATAQATAAARAAGPFPDESTEQLTYRASAALLELDEAARTSSLDLDFARAQYGEEPVAGFAQALAESQAELARAFTLRQQLDDEMAEDEAATRRMLAEVLRLTTAADERLDAQAEAFDRLRDLERTAPQVLDALGPQVAALQARLPQEEQRLTALRRRYADSALAPVADNVEQARARLAVAEQEVGEARADLQAGNAGRSVAALRAAEDAVAQSGTLLDGIGRLGSDLDAAAGRIAAVRAETETDLAEARALLTGPAAGGAGSGLGPLVARAEAALAAADAGGQAAAGQRTDPLAALRRLEEADAALDQALAGARDAAARARRAAGALEQTVLTARSTIAAAADFIGTRRGAVGPEARTRLAEAQRHLDAAVAGGPADPVRALGEAQQAAALAQHALDLAQADVSRWSTGGSLGPRYGGGGRTGVDLGSLVLGGILFGGGGQRGDGFGGGGSRGGSRGGGGSFGGGGSRRSSGSFGGSGSRGRRGGGGRF